MPLQHEEKFLTKLQKNNRIQIPTIIRQIHRLKTGDILYVKVTVEKFIGSEAFYARLGKDCRFTIPRDIVDCMEMKPGEPLRVVLMRAVKPSETTFSHASSHRKLTK